MQERISRIRLSTRFLLLLLTVIFVVLVCYIVFTDYQHRQQTEELLLSQAQAFAKEMDAVWQFFDVNQERINSDGEGNYVFKGLYCSLVGKGVGVIFSSSSDYIIRYTNTTVRNRFDRPDEFEQLALASFTNDPATAGGGPAGATGCSSPSINVPVTAGAGISASSRAAFSTSCANSWRNSVTSSRS
jgi:cell division protein FtsL